MINYKELIFDWNKADLPFSTPCNFTGEGIKVQDETLRDGLQAAHLKRHPSVELKKRILNIDSELGVESANLGFPASNEQQRNDVIDLARFVRDQKLGLRLTCATRTLSEDIKHIIEASEIAGVAIEAGMFLRSSQLGTLGEGWTIDQMIKMEEEGIGFAIKHGIPVMFVAEDSTRATPEYLKELYTKAIDLGASRICIADTVGFIQEEGISKLMRYIKEEVLCNNNIPVDFHGHNDLASSITNARAACKYGASRVHCTWLGVGERAGNVDLGLFLVQLMLARKPEEDWNLQKLYKYTLHIASLLDYKISPDYPLFGDGVFSTPTGTHARATEKIEELGLNGLAGLTFSPVNPKRIGRDYNYEVSPYSSEANVRGKLKKLGIEQTRERIIRILEFAKTNDILVSDETIRILCLA